MATVTVTGGGTVPLPPFAQPPVSARLSKATANIKFFIMTRSRWIISEPILFFLFESVLFEPARRESVARGHSP